MPRSAPGEDLRARVERMRVRVPVDQQPCCAYDLVTRQMVEQLRADLAEIRSRVNTLLWLVAGAVLLQITLQIAGLARPGHRADPHLAEGDVDLGAAEPW